MRCDLHVHTRYSGPVDLPGLRHLSRECYSEPGAVYESAKSRGMDLVTITDHDTIEGAQQLAHLPDFITGEEVTLEIAPGREIHLGVWDLTERDHGEISTRRQDPDALFAYLAEHRIPACINHPFSPLTGRREAEDFGRAFSELALVEAQNGMMPAATNEFARMAARSKGLATVGGSDAHTLDQVAHAFTTVPKAQDRSEFLQGLRAGFTVPVGGSGSYARLTRDVLIVLSGAVRENASRALGSVGDLAHFLGACVTLPLAPLIPLITLASFLKESWGGRAYHAAYRASLDQRPTSPSRHALISGLAAGGDR